MRYAVLGLLFLLVAGGAAIAADNPQDAAQIARGRYLAVIGDCAACHTEPGGKPYAGGRPIATPFGTLLAPNLTPDRGTGIGAWTDDEFVAALRQGKGRGGEHLYPAMPYTYYTRMTREDALAVRAYLATLDPVRHKVKANQLPFPFDIRAGMAIWNALYFSSGTFKPVAGKSAEWNRGDYLVEGPAHCGMCHTAKNFAGADKTGAALRGGLLQGWFAPDLAADLHGGLGGWTAADVVSYLKTGHNRFSAATGPMAEVVADSTSQMRDADLRAMADYLTDQKPAGSPAAPAAPAADTMRAGAAIYVDECAACHGAGGAGTPGLFPTLKASAMVQAAKATDLIRIVLDGAQSVATRNAPTGAAMPAFGWKLSDAQVAATLTYLRRSWGNVAAPVTAGDVADERRTLAKGGS